MKYKLLLLLLVFTGSLFSISFAYTTFKTPQGQMIIIEEMPNNPIVTIDTWIKTGSINEDDKNSGVSHFLEHLFFKGTQQYPTGMFDKILESKGAVSNAATSKDFTHYYITIPSAEFDTALKLHSDMLLHPLIPRKEMEMERKVVLEEIAKNNDSPERNLFNNLISILYKNHPYHREVIGQKNVIETISREDVLNYYNKYYMPSNMITVIVGDVKADDVKKKIKDYFGEDKKNKKIVNFYHSDKILNKQTQKIETFDVKNGYMLIGFRGVAAKNIREACALDVLATILGEGKTSRLYNEVKDKKQLAINISTSHSSYKYDSLFLIKATFYPENFEKLKNEIFSQIDKLKSEPILNSEIEKAKKIIERDTYYSRESGSNIANEIGYISVIQDNPKFYTNYISEINKVTVNDLKWVIWKYLSPNKAAISVLLPKDISNKKISEDKQENIVPLYTKQYGSLTKYILPNKATLLVDKNTTNDIIAIKLYSLGGRYILQKQGIDEITAAAMTRGTKNYSSYELSEMMEEKGIKIIPQANADSFSISLKTTRNEIYSSLNLLDEIINKATFNPYEVEKVKNDKLANIKQSRDNSSTVAIEEFKHKIWETNPYGTTGKILEKTIPTISNQQVIEFYNKIFTPENTVISVNGNVDDQQLINYFSKLFKDKKYTKINISNFKNRNKEVITAQTVKVDKKAEAAWLVLGWQVTGNDNLKEYATLQVMDSLLGTGMSSRLFVNLRDERGLAYQIGSFYLPNINHGLFGIYIGTNPQNYTIAKNDIFKEINKLKTKFVSEQELREAQDKLLGHYLLGKETNMEKASALGWFEASGRGVEFDKNYPKLIRSVTSEDIINVANKYFNNNYVMSVVAPQNELK